MNRPDSPSWIAAKAAGDRAEIAIAEWFQGRGFMALKTLGNAPFDLLLQAEVEVKRDLKASQTGNVAIEVKHNGYPSGIMSSTAGYWAIVLDTEAVILPTDTLRDCVLTGKLREVQAGDHLASTMRLLPLAKLKTIKGARIIKLKETVAANG
ncbi:MAG: hypothetical protein KDA68_04250 [Planctomycetaceae bacterium]|nr:hypothetical protein [Planctomycetaceae bacterium]